MSAAPARADRLGIVVPSMFALAVLSTSFTALGDPDRLRAALRGAAPHRHHSADPVRCARPARGSPFWRSRPPRWPFWAASASPSVGALTRWGLLLVVPLVLLGSATLASLALLLAGVVRAEATLAVANLAYLVLASAGVVVPVAKAPTGRSTDPRTASVSSAGRKPSRLPRSAAPSTGRWSLVLSCGGSPARSRVSRWFRWD